MGLSVAEIRSWTNGINAMALRHHPATIRAVRRLWDMGLSASAIAVQLDLTKNQVIGLAHRNHFPPRPSPIGLNALSLEEVRHIEALLLSGRLSYPLVARAASRSLSTVRDTAARLIASGSMPPRGQSSQAAAR